MRTPGHDEDLALGLLFSESVIDGWPAVASVSNRRGRCRTRGSSEILITLAESVTAIPVVLSTSMKTAACGLCGRTDVDHVLRSVKNTATPPPLSPEVIFELPRRVRAHQTLFERTGGLHAAALFDTAGGLQQLREDIGRHNAVDKIIGWGVRESHDFGQSILFLSGRAGFELVHKAACAGIPYVVAVGAPSSLAVDLAARSGVALIGFAKGETFNVYVGASHLAATPIPSRTNTTTLEGAFPK